VTTAPFEDGAARQFDGRFLGAIVESCIAGRELLYDGLSSSVMRALLPLVLGLAWTAACGFALTVGPSSSDSTMPEGGPAGRADGNELVDGGGPAADDAASDDGAPKPSGFCANLPPPRPEVCVDFDQTDAGGLAVGGGIGDAVATVTTDRAVSPPNSFRVSATQFGAQSYLFKTWPTTRAVVDVALDVFAEGAGYSQIGGVEIFAPTIVGSYQVMFASDAGQLLWYETVNGSVFNHPLPGPFQIGWHRVDMHAELIGNSISTKSRVRIRVDAKTEFDGELMVATPNITNVKADVGPLFYSAKLAPVTVFIDNVTIDSRP